MALLDFFILRFVASCAMLEVSGDYT